VDLAQVLGAAGGYLTERTGFVALAALPPRDHYPLDWVRLALAPGNRVLVTVRTLLGDLWSKLLVVPEPLAAELLKAVELHLCQTYRGVALELVRGEIMSGRARGLQNIAGPEGMAYRLLRRAFEWGSEPGLMTWRTEHLYDIEEFQSAQVLTRLYHALQDPQLLNKALAGGQPVDGGFVAIGTDIGVPGMESAALVAFPFGLNSAWRGRLAVLGPMRMNYSLVIQLLKGSVDYVEHRLKEIPVLATG
jgi:heat-inducible transcriptional repressor